MLKCHNTTYDVDGITVRGTWWQIGNLVLRFKQRPV